MLEVNSSNDAPWLTVVAGRAFSIDTLGVPRGEILFLPGPYGRHDDSGGVCLNAGMIRFRMPLRPEHGQPTQYRDQETANKIM